MNFSLYDATIPSKIQITKSISAIINKAIVFCAEENIDEQQLVKAKLAEDMLPLSYQISSVSHHSIGAIEGLRRGIFSPDKNSPPDNLADLKQLTDKSILKLTELDPDEINNCFGIDMKFQMGEFVLNYTAENFLLSFSQPNFYFHATTAYDILRMKGVNLGKGDFIGSSKIKR